MQLGDGKVLSLAHVLHSRVFAQARVIDITDRCDSRL